MNNTLQKTNTLFQIKEKYIRIIDLISENDDNTQLIQELEMIEDDLQTKIENYVQIIKKKNNDNEYIDQEIKRLEKIKKRNAYLTEWLKKNLILHLESMNKKRLETPLFKIYIRDNPLSVEIKDENIVPERFKEQRIDTHISKKEILDAFKKGEIIEGVCIKQSKSLIIS